MKRTRIIIGTVVIIIVSIVTFAIIATITQEKNSSTSSGTEHFEETNIFASKSSHDIYIGTKKIVTQSPIVEIEGKVFVPVDEIGAKLGFTAYWDDNLPIAQENFKINGSYRIEPLKYTKDEILKILFKGMSVDEVINKLGNKYIILTGLFRPIYKSSDGIYITLYFDEDSYLTNVYNIGDIDLLLNKWSVKVFNSELHFDDIKVDINEPLYIIGNVVYGSADDFRQFNVKCG